MGTASYDDIAEWYDGWVGGDAMQDDPYFPTVEALMGAVVGLHLCDLACGQGRVARHLAGLGARVTGVDLSIKLLAIARAREQASPRGIDYRHADARSLAGLADAAFDGVLCNMALMDIPNLGAVLQSIVRVLRPGGWFIFSTLHPCYNPPPSGEIETTAGWVRTVSGYWDEGYWRSERRSGPPGKVSSHHRTLSTYLNALAEAGLTLERIAEPRATAAVAAARPVWNEVPAVLVARCRRCTASAGS